MNTEALKLLCHTYLKSNMYESALRCAGVLIKLDREDPVSVGMYATAAAECGEYEKLLKITEKEEDPYLLLLRSAALFKTDRHEEAKATAAKAEKMLQKQTVSQKIL